MEIMDQNSNHTQGMNLSGPTGGQGAIVDPLGAVPGGGAGAIPQQSAPVAPSAQDTEETTTDEELDQIWVNKAKDIVEQTKTDPFTQSNELNKVKAEYLKVRFDKDLNVGDKTPQ